MSVKESLAAVLDPATGEINTQRISGRPGEAVLEQVELATAQWVDWYNNHRLHTSIGNLPPAEYEAAYYADRDGSAVA